MNASTASGWEPVVAWAKPSANRSRAAGAGTELLVQRVQSLLGVLPGRGVGAQGDGPAVLQHRLPGAPQRLQRACMAVGDVGRGGIELGGLGQELLRALVFAQDDRVVGLGRQLRRLGPLFLRGLLGRGGGRGTDERRRPRVVALELQRFLGGERGCANQRREAAERRKENRAQEAGAPV